MLHKPAESGGDDHAVGYKTKLGLRMFAIYGLVYAGFVLINIIKPILMETIIMFGLNLAVVYGFGLIILALIMALVYNQMCVKQEKLLNTDENEKQAQ
jgi:uncharacterized membrane protein (DUF485 family)